MANKEIHIPLKVDDQGSTKKKTEEAKALRAELEKASKAASELGSPTGGSQTLKKAKERAVTPQELVEYNSQRGSARTSGGTARDFAAQAQGLGGLVRLYATFAANIYAVSTAFNALKEAANIDKMIQSSTKFSIVTGNNLNSIAKDLQKATDYTLAFQDAIKFTNIGTAAGLSGKEIQNLTVIAKGAASALGRDVGESIQRIIQGTAKQEQEILDELGIFVKSKKAFEEYAQARNIKVDDLTARQRTLAYAEAVAKAGEQWKEFAGIEDPYAKLMATSKQALQDILSTINKIIQPIIKLFADNADAIKAVALLITGTLVKKALPELKTALMDSFSFKNLAAIQRTKEAKDSLVKEYTDLNAKLTDLKQKRESLMSFDLSKEGQMKLLGSRVDPNAIQKGAGSKIDYGLSLQRASTAIFGNAKEPVDLKTYKSAADVQDRLTAGIKKQLEDSKNMDAVLQSLIAKKVVEEGSTSKNLVLTQATKKFSQETFEVIQRINQDSAKRNALEKDYEVTVRRVAVAKKDLQKANILPEDIADPSFIGPPTRQSSKAAEELAKANRSAAGTVASFQTGLLANSKAMDIYNSKAVNMTSSTVAFGTYLKSLPATLTVATAGLSGLSKAGAVAGTSFAFLGGALSIVARGFMAALGPISLLWTAWELFGDSLKKYIPFINWSTKEMELQKEATADLAESLKTSNASLARNIELVSSAGGNIDKLIKGLEGQANAYRSISNALDDYNKKLEENNIKYGAGKGPEDLAKKYGESSVNAVAQANTVVAILKKAQESGNLTATQSVKATETVIAFGKALEDLEKSKKGPEAINKLLKDSGTIVKEASDQVGSVLETRLANVQRANSAAETLSRVAQEIDDKRIEAEAKGLKGNKEALAVYKSLISYSEAYKKAQDVGDRVSIQNRQVVAIQDLINKTKGLTIETTQLAEARLLVADIAVWEQVAASAGTNKVALDTANAQLSNLKARLIQVTSGTEEARMGMAKLVLSTEKNTEKVKELTKAEKAEIALRKQKIAQLEASNQALQSRIALEDRLSGVIAKASGKEQEGVSQSKQKLIQDEKALAIAKASLAQYEAEAKAPKNKEGDLIRKEAAEAYKLELQAADAQEKTKLVNLELDRIQAIFNNRLKEAADRRAEENELITLRNRLEDTRLESFNAESTRRLENLGYLKEEVDLYSTKLERQKLITEAAREAEQLERDKKAKLDDTKSSFGLAKETAKTVLGDGTDAYKNKIAELTSEQEAKESRINDFYASRLTLLQQILGVQLERNASETEYKSLLASQAKEMSKISKLSDSLEGLFKGTGLEKQAKGFADFIKSSTSGKQKLAKLDNEEKVRKLQLSKLQEESTKDGFKDFALLNRMKEEDAEMSKKYAEEKKAAELDLTLATISSFKSMMSEKTAGYKVLDAFEKALHIYRMTVAAIELATDIKNTVVSVTNSATRTSAKTAEAGVDAVGAVIKAISSLPFPLNLVAGAATAAVVFSLLSSIGGKGKKSVSTAGMTAKDRQETQGTGMTWKDGKKVESGGGVFGDAEAKSESIKNSLEIIKENTIEGLSYDNKMLKALESIDRAISGVSTSLYRIPGIRTGSAFGTTEGSSGSKSLWGIFGSKKQSVEIIDSGVKLAGTFKDLAKGGQGLINFYETVQTTSTSSGFLGLGKKTSTSIATNVQSASPEITQAVASVFSYATDLFKDVGSKIGKTAEDIDTALSSISFDQLLSLRGLKGEDLEKEFNAVISSMLDSTADALFSEMKRFQKFGEGMLETVVRVVDANKKLNDGLNAIGQSSALKSANKALGYDVTEKLLEAVGGLDAFTEQIGFFRDEFLTEAERLAPIRQAVTEEMSRLGYSMVDTREEFKALVQSLDLTIPAQQELYASLMRVAKGFAEVYEATEQKERLKAEEYRTRLIDLEVQGLELLGNKTQALAAQRALEIEEVRKLVPEQAAQIEYYKKVIWAIEDSLEVRNAEIEVLGALGFTYDQMLLQREMELQGLTEQVRAVKRWQFAVEDFNNSQDLMIELLNKSGKESQAVALSRERELKGLNSTDKLIKRAIYALEDEEAIREKLEEAKQKELELKEKEYQTIKDTTSATRDYIRSLKDYRNSLLKGNLSTLTPLQKYEQTRMVALETAAKAMAVATTEEEKRAQKEARDKLQGNTSDFLEAARVLYASGTPYTQDFNTVLSTIDKAIAAAGTELSDAEKQLKVLDESKQKLQKIEENTKSVAQLTAELTAAQKKTAEALAKVPDNLSAVYKMDELYTYIAGLPEVIKNLPQTLLDAISSVSPTGNAVVPNIPGLTVGTNLMGPINTNPNPEQEALVDQAVINIQNNSQTTNDLTRQLITEINNLKEEIVQLKAESRANTEALITAEFRSGNNVATQVQEGFERAANTIAWNKDKNTVVLR